MSQSVYIIMSEHEDYYTFYQFEGVYTSKNAAIIMAKKMADERSSYDFTVDRCRLNRQDIAPVVVWSSKSYRKEKKRGQRMAGT